MFITADSPDVMFQPNHFFDKLRANGLNLVAMEGGSAVERIRKMFHEEMSTKAVTQWQGLQASNAAYTAVKLLEMTGETTVADIVEKYGLPSFARIVLTDRAELRNSSQCALFAESFHHKPGQALIR